MFILELVVGLVFALVLMVNTLLGGVLGIFANTISALFGIL